MSISCHQAGVSGTAWYGDDSPHLCPVRDDFLFQKRVQRARSMLTDRGLAAPQPPVRGKGFRSSSLPHPTEHTGQTNGSMTTGNPNSQRTAKRQVWGAISCLFVQRCVQNRWAILIQTLFARVACLILAVLHRYQLGHRPLV